MSDGDKKPPEPIKTEPEKRRKDYGSHERSKPGPVHVPKRQPKKG